MHYHDWHVSLNGFIKIPLRFCSVQILHQSDCYEHTYWIHLNARWRHSPLYFHRANIVRPTGGALLSVFFSSSTCNSIKWKCLHFTSIHPSIQCILLHFSYYTTDFDAKRINSVEQIMNLTYVSFYTSTKASKLIPNKKFADFCFLFETEKNCNLSPDLPIFCVRISCLRFPFFLSYLWMSHWAFVSNICRHLPSENCLQWIYQSDEAALNIYLHWWN